MATWSSSPLVSHTGGTFDFPKNTGTTDIVYTITYTDDNNCSTSIEYTIPTGSTCQPSTACTCNDLTLEKNRIEVSPLAYSAYEEIWIEFSADCESISASSNSAWLDFYIYINEDDPSDKAIQIKCQANTNDTDRTGYITFTIDGNTCNNKRIEVYQYRLPSLLFHTGQSSEPWDVEYKREGESSYTVLPRGESLNIPTVANASDNSTTTEIKFREGTNIPFYFEVNNGEEIGVRVDGVQFNNNVVPLYDCNNGEAYSTNLNNKNKEINTEIYWCGGTAATTSDGCATTATTSTNPFMSFESTNNKVIKSWLYNMENYSPQGNKNIVVNLYISLKKYDCGVNHGNQIGWRFKHTIRIIPSNI